MPINNRSVPFRVKLSQIISFNLPKVNLIINLSQNSKVLESFNIELGFIRQYFQSIFRAVTLQDFFVSTMITPCPHNISSFIG